MSKHAPTYWLIAHNVVDDPKRTQVSCRAFHEMKEKRTAEGKHFTSTRGETFNGRKIVNVSFILTWVEPAPYKETAE